MRENIYDLYLFEKIWIHRTRKGEEIQCEKENEKIIIFMLIHLRSLSHLTRKYFLFCVI